MGSQSPRHCVGLILMWSYFSAKNIEFSHYLYLTVMAMDWKHQEALNAPLEAFICK